MYRSLFSRNASDRCSYSLGSSMCALYALTFPSAGPIFLDSHAPPTALALGWEVGSPLQWRFQVAPRTSQHPPLAGPIIHHPWMEKTNCVGRAAAGERHLNFGVYQSREERKICSQGCSVSKTIEKEFSRSTVEMLANLTSPWQLRCYYIGVADANLE